MSVALIVCGALAREVRGIVQRYAWDARLFGISAAHHQRPARIAQAVETKLLEVRNQYDRVIVVYGDCGTYGVLDHLLDRYGIERISGPHCYEMFAGADFDEFLVEEPGTYFLTDFMVRTFKGTILKGMGLDRYPELRADYFRHYRRIVYLTQQPEAHLMEQAAGIADDLQLPLNVHIAGCGSLETRLVELMETPMEAEA